MGSFFYWLYAVGYKLLHRYEDGEHQGNEDKEFRHIHLEYPVFNWKLWKAASGICR